MTKKNKGGYQKPGVAVKVEWGDAWGNSGWKTGELDHTPLKVTSIGFVRRHDKFGISMSRGVDENGAALGNEFIPGGMIFKVIKMK